MAGASQAPFCSKAVVMAFSIMESWAKTENGVVVSIMPAMMARQLPSLMVLWG